MEVDMCIFSQFFDVQNALFELEERMYLNAWLPGIDEFWYFIFLGAKVVFIGPVH